MILKLYFLLLKTGITWINFILQLCFRLKNIPELYCYVLLYGKTQSGLRPPPEF